MNMPAAFMSSRNFMIKKIRSAFGRCSIFSFNLVNRDRWVANQATQLPDGSRVLDVGAGSCPYRPLFAHCKYHAQDFTSLQNEQLRHGGYGQIDYVCDAVAIPAEDGGYDAILCTEMLEHVADPLAVVRELARLLKPGGKLMLTAPLGSGIHQEPHHYYGGFTPYWYQRFLAEVGFRDIRVESNAGSLRFFAQESIRFLTTTRPFIHFPLMPSIFWLPFWICLLPILGLIVPLASHALDRYDREQRFTVGYHVTAIR